MRTGSAAAAELATKIPGKVHVTQPPTQPGNQPVINRNQRTISNRTNQPTKE
jgi:hypothetical protein